MKEEVPVLEYSDVSIESRGTMVPVRLKLSDQGITFRNVKTGKVESLGASDLEVVNWQRLAGGYGLRIFTENGNLYRFGGFKESEQSKLEKFFKNTYSKTMTEKEFSVKGWNYGAAKFEGAVLSFDVSSTPSFEVPLNNVSGCTTGKNEVTLEFHQHDDAAINLMEMRFHLPTSELAGDDPVENFQQRVMSKASIITATGDALAIFREVQCLTPRGRYDIKIYPTFIQLHGKTFDFKIPVTTVLRLFLLPHPDQRQHFFVVSLDPPIKQGQTRYPYLILLFSGDDTDFIELPLEEEELQEKYEGRLEKEMSGAQFEVISKMFKGICNRKIVTPGNFTGHSGSSGISCSYKAAAGYLYPLERGLIYVHKPPVHIRFDEISSVNFARSGSTTRSFDFEVEIKSGGVNTFSSIEKGEYNRLFDYVNQKKLRIKNRGKMEMGTGRTDDFDDSDADEPDPYMRRVREEAKERDDEDSSEDEDFVPGEGGSDVAEEYDSFAGDSTDSDEGSEGGSDDQKKKEKKKEKQPKAKTVSEKPRKRKPKKEKDANKPKRPQSAYFIWLNEHREQIKKENPGISITEVSKVAGQKWKTVDDKSEWEAKAAEAKKEYEEAMNVYKASLKTTTPPKKSPKKAATTSAAAAAAAAVSPTKAGSGSGFKSKEFIDESSSSEDSDDKPLKKKAKTEKPEKAAKKPKKEESEGEEDASEEASDEASDEDSGSD
ncbi:FACT complex subunit Ssrp1-like [Eriocheir sinensis]|uniref:FACT complex subunit Ssrp1-like n=1 Tax=Eriocheir sinensis TaxID=95602 RepID=UPI0021C81A00|nr:FACT complex subunit Ssrp1-like [Eriocheir sinensis]